MNSTIPSLGFEQAQGKVPTEKMASEGLDEKGEAEDTKIAVEEVQEA